MKQAINTRTQEEYDALMRYYRAQDVSFRGGGYPKYEKYQAEYGAEMCIVWSFVGDKCLSVGSASFYDQRGYEIIPYTEFAKTIKPEPNYKAMYNEVKDILECIAEFDDEATPYDKGKYFDVIQRDVKQALKRWEDGE